MLKLNLSALPWENHKVSGICVADLPAEVWKQGFVSFNFKLAKYFSFSLSWPCHSWWLVFKGQISLGMAAIFCHYIGQKGGWDKHWPSTDGRNRKLDNWKKLDIERNNKQPWKEENKLCFLKINFRERLGQSGKLKKLSAQSKEQQMKWWSTWADINAKTDLERTRRACS